MASNSKPHAGSRTPLPDSSNGEWERQARAHWFGQNEPYSQKKPDSMESSELLEAIIYLCGTETALEKQNRHFRNWKMLFICKEEFLKRLPGLKEGGESWLSKIDKLDISEVGKAALEKDATDFKYDSEGISSFFSPLIYNQIDKNLGKKGFRTQYMNTCNHVNQGRELKDWEWGHALQETLVLDPKLEEEFSTEFRKSVSKYAEWEKLNNLPGSGSLISKIQPEEGASSSGSQPEFILPLDKSQPIFKEEAVDLSSINTLDIIKTIVYLVRTETPEENLACVIYRWERAFALRNAFHDKNLQNITVAEWSALVARLPASSAIRLRGVRTEGDGADKITSNPKSKSKSRDEKRKTDKSKFFKQLSDKLSYSSGFFREFMILCEVMNEGKPFDQWSWAPAMELFNSIQTSSSFAKSFKEYFSEKLDNYKKDGKFLSAKYQV